MSKLQGYVELGLIAILFFPLTITLALIWSMAWIFGKFVLRGGPDCTLGEFLLGFIASA